MRSFIISAAITTLLLSSFAALAKEPGNIRFQSIAEVEITTTGENGHQVTKRVTATKVQPDTEVIYTNLFTNIGQEPASDITITNPVPAQMNYVDGSAAGKDTRITFSIDKGETFDIPGNLFVTGKDGKPRQAGASDFTDIRWQINTPLPPGETGSVTFRALLN